MSETDTSHIPASKRLLYAVQATVLRATLAFLRRLPLELASAIGGFVFRTVGPFLGAHRVAQENLRRAFPEKSEAERARILRGVWDNLGRGAAEWSQVERIDTTDPARVELLGEDHLLAARDSGAPFIVFSAHIANWEMASVVAVQRGCALSNIYRAAANPGMDRLIREKRAQFTGALLPKGREGAKGALKAMKDGHPLGLLIDQKFNEGLAIPFFGRPAMTASAPAELALRFRCRVLPVRLERLPRARFRITVKPPMVLPDSGERARDVETLLTAMNAEVESWVRERPDQWFWVHRRWPKDG